MPRDAVRDEVDALRKFLRGLHAGIADLAIDARRVAALGEAVLGIDRVEVLVDHELDTDVRRALLACFGEEDHVAVERDEVALQLQHRHERRP